MENEMAADMSQFNPHVKRAAVMRRSTVRHPHTSYKAALVVNDFVWSLLAFFGCFLLFSDTTDLVDTFSRWAALVIIALAAIVLFQSCRLYNYHVIYDARRHLLQLALAWGCTTLMLFSVFALLMLGGAATRLEFAAVALAIAILLLLLRKYKEEHSTQFLIAVGLGFIVAGLLELQGEALTAVFIQSYPVLIAGLALAIVTVSLTRYLMVHQLFNKTLRRRFRRQTVIVLSLIHI